MSNISKLLEMSRYFREKMDHIRASKLYVLELVLSCPGIYLREVQQRLFNYTGTWIHGSTICRTLQRLSMTCQKIEHVALQRSDSMQNEFIAEVMMVFDASMCLWIDETGCDQRNGLRKYGYGIRGSCSTRLLPQVQGQRYSSISFIN